MNKKTRSKTAKVSMELSTFEIPPSGDALVLGKRCPIGAHAAKKMLDTIAPKQFDLIKLEDDIIEAVLVRKHLFARAEKEALVRTIVEEGKMLMGDTCMLSVKCNIRVSINREL